MSPCLLLREADVEHLATIHDAIREVRELVAQWRTGGVINIPRRRVHLGQMMLHGMSAGATYLGRAGWKQYTTTSTSARFYVGLYSQRDGSWQALIEADRLGQLRTGAMSAVAVELLKFQNLRRLAVIGAGKQAETQVLALCATGRLDEVRVYSRDPLKRQAFAERMSKLTGLTIVPVDRVQAATERAEIIVTATPSRTPVIQVDELPECRLLIAMGSNSPSRREFPSELFSRIDRVVCDDVEACQIEAGELIDAAQSGNWSWDSARSIWDDLSLLQIPSQGLTLFKSVGVAAADLALASWIYDRAIEKNLGVTFPLS